MKEVEQGGKQQLFVCLNWGIVPFGEDEESRVMIIYFISRKYAWAMLLLYTREGRGSSSIRPGASTFFFFLIGSIERPRKKFFFVFDANFIPRHAMLPRNPAHAHKKEGRKRGLSRGGSNQVSGGVGRAVRQAWSIGRKAQFFFFSSVFAQDLKSIVPASGTWDIHNKE